jgi:hypothetical protein
MPIRGPVCVPFDSRASSEKQMAEKTIENAVARCVDRMTA